MFMVALYSIDTEEEVQYYGMFDSHDEAEDYLCLGCNIEDYVHSEILEIHKVASAVV